MSPRATRARYAASASVFSDCKIYTSSSATRAIIKDLASTYPEPKCDERVPNCKRQCFPQARARNAGAHLVSMSIIELNRYNSYLNMIVASDVRRLFVKIVYGASPSLFSICPW